VKRGSKCERWGFAKGLQNVSTGARKSVQKGVTLAHQNVSIGAPTYRSSRRPENLIHGSLDNGALWCGFQDNGPTSLRRVVLA